MSHSLQAKRPEVDGMIIDVIHFRHERLRVGELARESRQNSDIFGFALAVPKIRVKKESRLGKLLYLCGVKLKTREDMSIDTYKLTSMEEPTDEVLSQLMREAAEDARKADAQATERYFYELKQAAAAIK